LSEKQPAPGLLDRGEQPVETGCVCHISGQQKWAAQRFGQRPHALFQGLALICEGESCAVCGENLGYAPRERAVVGDAHNQPAFAGHEVRLQFHHNSYDLHQ